jgi:hypothetical protein
MFRSKKLDLGCFINIKVIRDHTKRKVFAEHETQRYVSSSSIDDCSGRSFGLVYLTNISAMIDKLYDTSFGT